jgi:hypothetical protein
MTLVRLLSKCRILCIISTFRGLITFIILNSSLSQGLLGSHCFKHSLLLGLFFIFFLLCFIISDRSLGQRLLRPHRSEHFSFLKLGIYSSILLFVNLNLIRILAFSYLILSLFRLLYCLIVLNGSLSQCLLSSHCCKHVFFLGFRFFIFLVRFIICDCSLGQRLLRSHCSKHFSFFSIRFFILLL